MKKKFASIAAGALTLAIAFGSFTTMAMGAPGTAKKVTEEIPTYQSLLDLNDLKAEQLAGLASGNVECAALVNTGYAGTQGVSLYDPNPNGSGYKSELNIKQGLNVTADKDSKYFVFYLDCTKNEFRVSWYRLYQGDDTYDTDNTDEDGLFVYVQDDYGNFVKQAIDNTDGCPNGFGGYKGLVAIPIEYFTSGGKSVDLTKPITGVGVTISATVTDDNKYKDVPVTFDEFGFAKELPADVTNTGKEIQKTIPTFAPVFDLNRLTLEDILACVDGDVANLSLAKGYMDSQALAIKDTAAQSYGGFAANIHGEKSVINATVDKDSKYVVFYMDCSASSIRKSWYRLYQGDNCFDTDNTDDVDDMFVLVQDKDGKFVKQAINNTDGCPDGFEGYKGFVAIPVEYFSADGKAINLEDGPITGVGVTFAATETTFINTTCIFDEFGFAKELPLAEEPAPAVDKTALTKAYTDGSAIDLKEYKDGAEKDAFSKALTDAKAIIEKADATQDEVDAAAKAIADTQVKLVKNDPVPANVNKEELTAAQKVCEALDLKLYADGAEKDAFVKAIADAKAIIEKADATQEEVDAAAKALKDTQAALKPAKVDVKVLKDALEKLYKEDAAVDLNKYNDGAEKDAFVKALKDAKEVIDKADATSDEINAALKALTETRLKLVIIKSDPGPKNDPAPKDDPAQKTVPNQEKPPVTGDAGFGSLVALAAMAGCAAIIIKKSK